MCLSVCFPKSVTDRSENRLLALLCDVLIDKGNRYKLSDDDIKEKLTHTLDVFDLLSDKDYFEEHYRCVACVLISVHQCIMRF